MSTFEDYVKLVGGIPEKVLNPDLENILKLESESFDFSTGLNFWDCSIKGQSDNQIMSYLQDPRNNSWGVLKVVRDEMILEFELLKKYISEFVNSNFDSNFNPIEVNYVLQGLILRHSRLLAVLKPKYYLASAKVKYHMAIAYWPNDEGVDKASFIKNIGLKENLEHQMAALFEKIFASIEHDSLETQVRYERGYHDFVIFKDGKKWIVELKILPKVERDSGDLIMTFLSIELWKKYKTIYQVL